MKKIDFLIFYEHKNREFESIVLLKHELVKRGYTVEYWSFYEKDIKKRKKLFNNVNIAVMPSLYHDEEILNIVYGIAGKVKNIVNLRWEQIFPKATERNLDYYVYPKGKAKMGYHCCWGNKPYETLLNAGMKEDKLFITGPIHIDFVRDQFRKYYLSKDVLFEKYGIKLNKKCILFTSSFAISSLNQWELEWFFSQYEGEEKEYYKMNLEHETESRDMIVKWLIRLAHEKDITIVYRPHPAEAKTELIEKLTKENNVKVISDYNVKQWILTCDQVYTWNSTSIIEASAAGIPCAVLRPVRLEESEEYSIYEDLPYITTYEKLSEYCDNGANDKSSLLVDNKKINDYLSIDDSIPSYIKTVNVLVQAHHDDYSFPWYLFSDIEFNEIEQKFRKKESQIKMANIIIKSFYNTKYIKRIMAKLFKTLNNCYNEKVGNEKRIITEKEFEDEEQRLSIVLP